MKNQKGEALTVAVVLLMLGMMIFGHSWGMMRGDHGQRHNDHDAKEHQLQKDESIRRGETRPTLDPKLFQDERVRSAYQAAREIPWVLDSIYCYCFCEESFQHKSLLSCYVDDHAAG